MCQFGAKMDWPCILFLSLSLYGFGQIKLGEPWLLLL